jgi:hypothetical protein
MTWFIVIICEILLILFGVVIVLLSAELPQSHYVVKPQQPPFDNPSDSSDNRPIDEAIGEYDE